MQQTPDQKKRGVCFFVCFIDALGFPGPQLNFWGPFQKAGYVNTEYVEPELRETHTFPFHKAM